MSLRLCLSLSGEAEKFVRRMAGKSPHITPEELIGSALWLLKTAQDTRRIALLSDGWKTVANHDQVVERTIIAYDPMVLQKDIQVGPSFAFERN